MPQMHVLVDPHQLPRTAGEERAVERGPFVDLHVVDVRPKYDPVLNVDLALERALERAYRVVVVRGT